MTFSCIHLKEIMTVSSAKESKKCTLNHLKFSYMKCMVRAVNFQNLTNFVINSVTIFLYRNFVRANFFL